jgi:hypothetical protein
VTVAIIVLAAWVGLAVLCALFVMGGTGGRIFANQVLTDEQLFEDAVSAKEKAEEASPHLRLAGR